MLKYAGRAVPLRGQRGKVPERYPAVRKNKTPPLQETKSYDQPHSCACERVSFFFSLTGQISTEIILDQIKKKKNLSEFDPHSSLLHISIYSH